MNFKRIRVRCLDEALPFSVSHKFFRIKARLTSSANQQNSTNDIFDSNVGKVITDNGAQVFADHCLHT